MLGLALAAAAVAGAVQASPAIDTAKALAARRLLLPVEGVPRKALRDTFSDRRGARKHHALDIMAPRGTPVLAADDGLVAKLTRNPIGGITLYQYDPDRRFVYYYAHLDGYAKDLAEGQFLRRGQVLGYVGSTGNAPEHAPHLHFSVFRLGADKRWWRGTAVNPFPYLRERAPTNLARQGGGS